MRLKSVRLAGFKSFVDPTNVALRSNLVGIVGPNGCGKSNVVDAIRWVLGESSAKQLRGDEMADVIFNGSSARKPVGQASVELLFDNADGGLGGQYAAYAEVSVKRQVGRDGLSAYSLNGTRCRRRDITGLFLGTGLGPHSYAIIEQGMVSRLIEMKPEELRVLIEEAAGISLYRERRRETENRIARTRENLDRIGDLRGELGRQLGALARQAQAAERYQRLRADERQRKTELLAVRLRTFQAEGVLGQARLLQLRTAQEARLAEQRAIERSIESLRVRQQAAHADLAKAQERFYAAGAEIARVEQRLDHGRNQQRQARIEIAQLERDRDSLALQIAADERRVEELRVSLTDLAPRLAVADQELQAVEALLEAADRDLAGVQGDVERLAGEEANSRLRLNAAQQRLDHLSQALRRENERRQRLRDERQALGSEQWDADEQRLRAEGDRLAVRCGELETARGALDAELQAQRQSGVELGGALDRLRRELQAQIGRRASLQALQEGVFGDRYPLEDWLASNGLAEAVRLVARLRVRAPWELAVETVLGVRLGALIVPDLDQAVAKLGDTAPRMALFDERTGQGPLAVQPWPTLADQVEGASLPTAWFAGICRAADRGEAQLRRGQLGAGEMLVTPDGCLWGPNWYQAPVAEDAGAIGRQRDLAELTQLIDATERSASQTAGDLAQVQQRVGDLERQRHALLDELSGLGDAQADVKSELGGVTTHAQRSSKRLAELVTELTELDERIARDEAELALTEHEREAAAEQARSLAGRLVQLREIRTAAEERRRRIGTEVGSSRAQRAALGLERQSLESELAGLAESSRRWRQQLARSIQSLDEKTAQAAQGEQPIAELEASLQQLLRNRGGVDAQLDQARRVLESHETDLRAAERQRAEVEAEVQARSDTVGSEQLHVQELQIKAAALQEQATELGTDLASALAGLDEQADEAAVRGHIEQLAARIERLGPINLAAVDEHAQVAERKQYLDSQQMDIEQALATMEEAIRKIDRETRSRFQETHDKIRARFQDSFPKLFGGGHASLELTSDDLLTTGVTVTARPPGKRNSSINQLSGGEKALTAIALIFAIFELNPAPFCVLDEVDAPLDDSNVQRYCDLVKEMSQRVQFVLITHNKTTMALAHQLSGVTMAEPGVSRLVEVDLDDAARLASA